MLLDVSAIRFDRAIINGRTEPILLAVESLNGDEVDVIAKFANQPHLTVNGLVREAIAAMLAVDLGLPIPEPLIVRIDGLFIDSVEQVNPRIADRLKKSTLVGFGSKKLPSGFNIWAEERGVPSSVLNQAAEICAFDSFTQNADRNKNSPNTMWDGSSFAIIDHELAFQIEGILFWKPPWEIGSLTDFIKNHLFYKSLVRKPIDLNEISKRWVSISDNRLVEYENAIPVEWRTAQDTITTSLNLIRNVRDNIDAAINEVDRALQ